MRNLDIDIYLEYLFNIKEKTSSSFENDLLEQSPKVTNKFVAEIDENDFQIFLEKKLIKNPVLIPEFNVSDEIKYRFENFQKFLFLSLIKNFNRYRKIKNQDYVEKLNKIHPLSIAFMYCKASNRKKVDIIFNLFSKNGKMVKNDQLKEFFYSLFSINSIIYLKSLLEFYKDDEKCLSKFSEEFTNKLLELYKPINIINLSEGFITEMFEGSSELTRDELERKFVVAEANGLWIFYGAGIRNKLENHVSNNNS